MKNTIEELRGSRIVKTGINVYEVRSKNGLTIYEGPTRAECKNFLKGDLPAPARSPVLKLGSVMRVIPLNDDSPEPGVDVPVFMSGDLSETQKEVLMDEMIRILKLRTEYFSPENRLKYEEWSFFDMLYVALADQASDFKRRIEERAEYDNLFKKIKEA